jgi:hypothetical protein
VVVVGQRHASEDLAARGAASRIPHESTNGSSAFPKLLEIQKMDQGWDPVVRTNWRNSDMLRVSQGESADM